MASSKVPNQTTPPGMDAKKLMEAYSGAGKYFNAKFVGSVDVDPKRDRLKTICCHALQALKAAAQHKKFKKQSYVLGLTVKGLSVMNERDRNITRIPLEKVMYVSHNQEDPRYFGVIIASVSSHTGHKLYAYKSETKIARAFVASCAEVFHFRAQIKKAKEMVKEQRKIEEQCESCASSMQQQHTRDEKVDARTTDVSSSPPPSPDWEDQPPQYKDVVHTFPMPVSLCKSTTQPIQPVAETMTTGKTMTSTSEMHSKTPTKISSEEGCDDSSRVEQHSQSSPLDSQDVIEEYDEFVLGQIQPKANQRDSSSSGEEDYAETYDDIGPHLIQQLQNLPVTTAAHAHPQSQNVAQVSREPQPDRVAQSKIVKTEQKELDQLRPMNRQESLKKLKQFKLPKELECLFVAEMTQSNSKGKEHLDVKKGERISIIIASHAKLPKGKYLAEKYDGTFGFVDASKTKKAPSAEATGQNLYHKLARSVDAQIPPPPPTPLPLSPTSASFGAPVSRYPASLRKTTSSPEPPPLPPPRRPSNGAVRSPLTRSLSGDTKAIFQKHPQAHHEICSPSHVTSTSCVKTPTTIKPLPLPCNKLESDPPKPSLPTPLEHNRNPRPHQTASAAHQAVPTNGSLTEHQPSVLQSQTTGFHRTPPPPLPPRPPTQSQEGPVGDHQFIPQPEQIWM